MALTDKQRVFCDEYLIDLNATQAAIRAGYSEKTASEIGAENLTKPSVAGYIHRRMREREARTEVTADRVLRELASIGFSRATDIAAIEGPLVSIKPTADWPDDVKRAVIGIEQGNFGIKVKLGDKIKALELIGKHLGMFTERPASEDDDETGVVILPPRLPK